MQEGLTNKKAWVGLDGFVDKLAVPVKLRNGFGDDFESFESITEFGQKIDSAQRSNMNIELYYKQEKMGGNGPLLANALANTGVNVRYVGTLGDPIHPVFKAFTQKVNAISLGEFGETQALEFPDGKVLLGHTSPMEAVTYERLISVIDETKLISEFSNSDLICFQNWTMLLHLSDIFEKILEKIWPKLSKNKDRICFFDLADPAKRTHEDCHHLLNLLPKFKTQGRVYLGVNRSEIRFISELLDKKAPTEILSSEAYSIWIKELKESLGINGLIVHCCDGAVAACGEETVFVPALKASSLTCLTGSGDHFNGGFLTGVLMNLSLEQCLQLGHITAVLYIEKGYTPSKKQIQELRSKLNEGKDLK